MLEEVKKQPKRPQKQNILVRVLIFLMTLALVMGALALVLARDKINFDSIRRFLTYRTVLQQSEAGMGEPFPCEGGLAAAVAAGGDLVCASQGGVRQYDMGGQTYVDETVPLTNPVVSASDFGVVVYDAGGSFLKIYRNRAEVFALPDGGGTVLAAHLNDSGWLAVVTRSEGYKAVITVYNHKFQPVNAFRLSSGFVMDAAVSPDCKTVAAVTVGQNGHTFESKLVTYPIRTADGDGTELTPEAELSIGNRVPLDLRWDAAGLHVLTEQSITAAGGRLEARGEVSWAGEYLKEFSQGGDGFYTMLIARHRAGTAARLITVDARGEVLGSLDLSEQILSVSAAGRYVAVLTAGQVEVFTRDLTPYAVSTEVRDARRVVVRPDGSLILLTDETAWLFVPQ